MNAETKSRLDQLRRGLRSASYATGWLALAGISLAIVLALDENRRLSLIGGAMHLAFWLLLASLAAVVGLAITRLRMGWSQSAALQKDMSAAVFAAVTSYMALGALPGTLERRTIDHIMEVQFGADYVRVTGGTGANLPRLLDQGIAPDFHPQRVYLANPGGDVAAGQRAAGILLDRGVTIAIVDGDCASACAYMAAMFPHRYITQNGRLGYHDIRAFGGRKDTADDDRQTLINRLVSQGISRSVVDRMFQSKAIVYPTTRELLRDKLVDSCWSEQARAPISCETALR